MQFFYRASNARYFPIHGLHQPFEMAIIVNVNLESLNLYVSLPQKRVIQIELEKVSGRLNEKKRCLLATCFPCGVGSFLQ